MEKEEYRSGKITKVLSNNSWTTLTELIDGLECTFEVLLSTNLPLSARHQLLNYFPAQKYHMWISCVIVNINICSWIHEGKYIRPFEWSTFKVLVGWAKLNVRMTETMSYFQHCIWEWHSVPEIPSHEEQRQRYIMVHYVNYPRYERRHSSCALWTI